MSLYVICLVCHSVLTSTDGMPCYSKTVCEKVYVCHFVLTSAASNMSCYSKTHVYACHFVLTPSDLLLMLCHVSLRLCDIESVVHTCMSLHSSKTCITVIAGNLSPDF